MKKQKLIAMIIMVSMMLSLLPVQESMAGIASSMAGAVEIQTDQLYDGESQSSDDAKWYKISTGSEFKDYYFTYSFEKGSFTALEFHFYDSNASLIASDWSYSPESAYIELGEDSTYYLEVYSRFGAPLEFTFNIQTSEDAPDNLKSARSVACNMLYDESISNNADEDWYKFKTPILGNFSFLITNPSDAYIEYRIYDSSKKIIIQNMVYPVNSDKNVLELPKNKTYYIQVISNNTYGKEAEYSFKITKSTLKNLSDAPSWKKLSGGYRKVTLSWNKSTNAAGYQIKYSKKSNMGQAKYITVKETKKTISSLKMRTYYYFQIRAYAINDKGKKVYSDWSDVAYARTAN